MKYLIVLVLFTSVCKAETTLKPWELDWSKAKPRQQQMNCTCTIVPDIAPTPKDETEEREPQQEDEN
jgi:hypothetical protein